MQLQEEGNAFEQGARSETILRAGALGELIALLIAAHAIVSGMAWLAVAPQSLASWSIAGVSAWVILRTAGWRSGQISSLVGTVCALAVTQWADHAIGETPAWLSKGPFSSYVIIFVLSCLFVVDLCDFPWRWGWTMAEWRRQIFERLQRIPTRVWGWGAVALFALYMIAVPATEAVWLQLYPPADQSRVLEDMTFGEAVRLRTTELFTAVWFFALGASVGSFLNVVVYRTPRRESLVMRRSACPKCGSQIAGKDNLPLIGWIRLRGKCRSCDLPISARYPLVEAFTGCLFLLFYFAELLSGGINLPVRIPNLYAGVVWIIFYTKWDLIGLYLFHCLLLSTLLAWSLIRLDGERLPGRSIATTFTLGLTPLLIWPELMLVPAGIFAGFTTDSGRIETILAAATGGATGAFSGLLVAWLLPRERSLIPREFVAGLAFVGAMLGWQAALSVTALTLCIHLLSGFCPANWRSHWSLTASLFSATIVQLLSWRAMATDLSSWWPVVEVSATSIAVWATVTAALLAGLWSVRPRMYAREPVDPLVSESAGQR